jgi:tetraacyldisaccharide 4'-kinase
MLKQLENGYKNLISSKTKWGFLLLPILTVLSWFYGFAIFLRNKLYNHKILPINKTKAPLTISIGSIVAGGTGKTPCTIFVAKSLEKESIAILTRGYRSKAENDLKPLVLNQENLQSYTADTCGDEPLLLAQNLPKANIYVSSNRSASAQQAVEDGAQILILEDGMQHRKLHRDFEIVILDANNPFGFGYLLPRGLLREPPSSLKRANLIILHHVRSSQQFENLKTTLSQYSNAPVIGSQLEIEGIFDLQNQQIQSINGKKIAMLCGIAQPEKFKETLTTLGAQIAIEQILPDHGSISENELRELISLCKSKNIEAIVCTEKDYVKLRQFNIDFPIYWVKIALNIEYGKEIWNDCLKNLNARLPD